MSGMCEALKPLALLATLVLTGLFAAELGASVTHTIGVARDQDDQEIRYIEHHQYLADGQHRVRYFSPEYELLAEKVMFYPGLPQHPTLTQSDFVTDTQITIALQDEIAEMIKTNSDEETSSFRFALADNIVIDAGFDTYIRANWEAFADSPKQRVKFAVAGQPRLLEMEIRRQPGQNGQTTYTVRPTNWLVRVLLPEIKLAYTEDRQLLRYEGFSNLKPGPGEGRHVVIEFDHYELDSALSKPLPDWIPENLAVK